MMVQTLFEIDGEHYKLKYQKVNTVDGELYQGIIFFKDPIGFSYVIREDRSIFFENKFLYKDFQQLIISVIEKKERKIKQK